MSTQLISYLQDHKHQILETWLGDIHLPPSPINSEDSLPLDHLSHLFDEILQHIATPSLIPSTSIENLQKYLSTQYPQHHPKQNTILTLEIIISGYTAFHSVLNTKWDHTQEFSSSQHAQHARIVRHALAQTLHNLTQNQT